MILAYLFIFILGACLGSFICVLVDRIPRSEQILKGRSYCEHCKHVLGPFDLIPIVSFVIFGGKCRYCHAKIPSHLVIVELTSAILLTLLYFFTITNGLSFVQFILLAIILLSLIGIFYTDVFSGIIPDEFIVSIALSTLAYLYFFKINDLFAHFAVGIATLLFFLILFLITKARGMGFGDVKFAFALGFFLGFPKIVICLYFAFLTATAVSLILIVLGKKKLKGGTISFGPFLVLGSVFAFLFTNQVLAIIFK